MEISKETQERIRVWLLRDCLGTFVLRALNEDEAALQEYEPADTRSMLELKRILANYSYSGQRIINEMEKNHRLSYRDALLHLNINEVLRNIYAL